MKHRDALSIHLAAHVGSVDPSLDPDLAVRPGIFWVDESGPLPVLKYRNAADDDWKVLLGGAPPGAITLGGELVTSDGAPITV